MREFGLELFFLLETLLLFLLQIGPEFLFPPATSSSRCCSSVVKPCSRPRQLSLSAWHSKREVSLHPLPWSEDSRGCSKIIPFVHVQEQLWLSCDESVQTTEGVTPKVLGFGSMIYVVSLLWSLTYHSGTGTSSQINWVSWASRVHAVCPGRSQWHKDWKQQISNWHPFCMFEMFPNRWWR